MSALASVSMEDDVESGAGPSVVRAVGESKGDAPGGSNARCRFGTGVISFGADHGVSELGSQSVGNEPAHVRDGRWQRM